MRRITDIGLARVLLFTALVAGVRVSGAHLAARAVLGHHRQGQTALHVAAYYYPWYSKTGRHWDLGYLRHDLTVHQAPLLGQYDSRNPSVLTQHFRWAQHYGINELICSWWGKGSYEDVTTRDAVLRSPSLGDTKISILYESLALLQVTGGLVWFDRANEQKLIADFEYLARTYFGNPHYYRIDGKPVVYLYVSRVYRGDDSRAIHDLRAAIKRRFGYDLYLVGDEVDWDGIPNPERIGLFDAITSYTMYSVTQRPGWPRQTGFLDGVRQRYGRFKDVASSEGVRFIPDVLPGFNDRGVRMQENHYVLPAEVDPDFHDSYSLFRDMLPLAAAYVDGDRPAIVVTSWNEWHEDTEIEPTSPAGPSAGPRRFTLGYAYYAHRFSLLHILKQFRESFRG